VRLARLFERVAMNVPTHDATNRHAFFQRFWQIAFSLLILTTGLGLPLVHAAPGQPSFSANTLLPFAQQIAVTRGLLQDARVNATVARLIASAAPQSAPRAWPPYRQRFVEPVRIRAGVAFWRAHAATLRQAQARYGVPAAVIVAIIGVETLYGRQTGNFRVLDTLATLALQYPAPERLDRVQLFRDQLADLIELHLAGHLDATTLQGSFAGAIGLPQFMPGSIKRYAVDGDGDGRIDLHASVADIVMSVANFLREHGWLPGLPVFAPVTLPDDPAALVTGGLTATLDWPQLQAAGAVIKTATADTGWQRAPLGVINLVDERTGRTPTRTPTQYRVATPNFFALTQYNRSYFYAAAVADLAAALRERIDAAQAN